MISYAQEVEHESPIKHHRVSIVLGHTHIPKGFNMDSTSFALIVPSWGLNYEFWFNQKWAVGLCIMIWRYQYTQLKIMMEKNKLAPDQ